MATSAQPAAATMPAFPMPAATPAYAYGPAHPPAGAPPLLVPAGPGAPGAAAAALRGAPPSNLLGDLASLNGANAAAAAALPADPPAGSLGALPAGWHVSTHPTYNRPYYYNAVTGSSQWTFPTSAAAVPLPQLPHLNQPPTVHSPGAMRRAFKELDGGVEQLAATLNLATARAPSHAPPSAAEEIL
jgi:hypothetical protein